jgi:serine-type D-Ala-D-Ala carboxypeptidase (penicillin-binding protein 5/6)
MTYSYHRPLLLACAFALSANHFSHAQTATPMAIAPPTLAASAYLLLDLTTGQTLASGGDDVAREPASLTKLMTAYVVFQALKQKQIALTQTVPVSVKAWKAEGSRMFIEPNKPVTVEELLRGMIVQSGNDASVALAEAVAGSEETFAQRMNAQAQRLGMTKTQFFNAAGLPAPGHVTNARDMAVLAAALIRDFPEYYNYYKEKSYTYNKITQENRNRLLFIDPSVDGVKTGHTQSAGYNLIASAQRDGRRLLSVVMGTASESARAAESKKLIDFGYGAYDVATIRKKNEAMLTPAVWKGMQDTVALGVADDWRINVARGAAAPSVDARMNAGPLVAPLKAGQVVGKVVVQANGAVVAERPLVVLQAVDEAGLFKRLWHSLKMNWSKT